MSWSDEYKQQARLDPEFKIEYEKLDFEFQLQNLLIENRKKADTTLENDTGTKIQTSL